MTEDQAKPNESLAMAIHTDQDTSNTSIANKFNSKPVEFKGWTIRMRMDNISDRNSASSFIANKLNEKFSFVAQTRRAIEDKITVYEGSSWLGKLSYRIKNNSLKNGR